MNKKTAILRGQLWGVVKMWILSFIFYLFSSVLLAAILNTYVEDGKASAVTALVLLAVLNACAFYVGYVRRMTDDYSLEVKTQGTFSWKGELISLLRSPHRNFLVIFGVLAVLYEIAMWLLPRPNPVSTALVVLFPIAGVLSYLPILDILLGYAVTVLVVFAVPLYARYRAYKYWKHQ